MKTRVLLLIAVGSMPVLAAAAADWPQWRGPNRDAKVVDFKAPSTWPKELTKKWSVPIGSGVDANTFEPSTEDAFASNGDGTLTVVQPPIVPGSFTLLVLEQ